MIAGRVPDEHGIASGFAARVGFTLFSNIATNFDELGKGNAGVDGDKWAPHTPEYLAYGRGPKSSRMGTGRAPAHADNPGSGYMNAAQRKVWWGIYRQSLAWTAKRMSFREAQGAAASIAWAAWKREGGRTLIEEYGHKRVGKEQIMVNYATLARSLQYGLLTDTGADAKYEPPHPMQVYEPAPGRVVLGTRAPGHQNHSLHGKRKDGQPRQRRFWPKRIPAMWWGDVLRSARSGLLRLREVLR